MSGFSAEWLALREPADAAARSAEVMQFVADALASRPLLTIVDLGAGTGSNVRYLASRIAEQMPRHPQAAGGHAVRWRLVDNDQQLLTRASGAGAGDVVLFASDLRTFDASWFDGADLITASALLDLVSAHWLDGLVERCRREQACVLATLNYDGRIDCTPADEDDALVRDLVNRHQHTDKGFGPALGPDAGRTAEAMLRAAGYDVRRATSDWVLAPGQAAIQRELVTGWATAARELRDDLDARIGRWVERRLAHIAAGASRMLVGHDDVAGVIR